MALDDKPETPDWWLLRHARALRKRQPALERWWRYYDGDHPLPQGPKKAAQAYLDFQKMSRTNFMQFVVDASVHRSVVMGINGANGQQDDAAWRWWQQNKLDSRQAQIYRLALAQSVAYVSVSEHPRIEGQPLITGEHPRQTITEESPETGETISGAKFWYDPILRRGRANVELPDRTVRYVTGVRGPGPLPLGGRTSWDRMSDERWRDGELPHGIGAVRLVPFRARYDLGEEPRADFDRVIGIQDRINLGVLNRMTAERYSAFRQKWVKGHKFRKTVDAATGLETVEQPFRPDPGGLWASEGTDTQFGEFSQTDLTGYLRAHEADVRALLILTHTPGYYYATDLVNISADTVSALDGSHIAKVGELHAEFGEDWEDVIRIAATIAGDNTIRDSIEIRWRDPRQLNPTVLADTAVKFKDAGYPLAVIAEKAGESPQRIATIVAAGASQALLQNALNAQAGVPAPPPAA
ncbi:phage portal protein [Polymorphospora rubra]|uniref:phage portal protein n=1 Tax=Polymorphospora rubra TaxID=338584 RepID=UPI0033C696A7